MFAYGSTLAENWLEIITAIRDPNKSVIVEDKRPDANSTHVCIFVGDSGQIIAVPIAVSEQTICIFTVKDVRTEQDNPNWYIRAYNEIAKTRGMSNIPLIIK